MRWLGLDWDEGPGVGGPHAPYFQTERLEQYRAAAASLVAAGRAYRCYCQPDDLKAKREAAEAAGGAWNVRPRVPESPRRRAHARERRPACRRGPFHVPRGRTTFDDLVHGAIDSITPTSKTSSSLRSDGHPTYHLRLSWTTRRWRSRTSCRGDDHISNTPKQVLLYQAMQAPVPAFAHVPLILGPDKKRLSKRHGATSVGEYEARAICPRPWSTFSRCSDGRRETIDELFTRDELVAKFSLEGISGGNAVFNPEKLDWFNQQHIARMTGEEILSRLGTDLERGRSRRRCACRSGAGRSRRSIW